MTNIIRKIYNYWNGYRNVDFYEDYNNYNNINKTNISEYEFSKFCLLDIYDLNHGVSVLDKDDIKKRDHFMRNIQYHFQYDKESYLKLYKKEHNYFDFYIRCLKNSESVNNRRVLESYKKQCVNEQFKLNTLHINEYDWVCKST